MQDQEELEVQQGIWIDERRIRDAGLGTRLRVVVQPGEIRILPVPAEHVSWTDSTGAERQEPSKGWKVFRSLGAWCPTWATAKRRYRTRSLPLWKRSTRQIFVDTSAWDAIADGGDPSHEVALLFRDEIAGQCRLIVTNYILDELYTLLLMNITKGVQAMTMTRVVQRVGANGLQLPKELVERWGAKEGQEVIIELARSFIRIVPAELDAGQIADRAATYVFDRVGDATAVGQPERVGERWRVPSLLSYRPKQLGVLIYSLRGELLPDESDSAQTMRERSREG